MYRRRLSLGARALFVLVLALTFLPVGAAAHDSDPVAPGVQPHLFGPYSLLDSVTSDLVNNTKTASYTVTVPSGAQDLSHFSVNLIVCNSALAIVAKSTGGVVENGDPSTGLTGPLVKWDQSQAAGTTKTYSYTVAGVFAPADTTVALKSGNTYFGTVQGVGCAQRGFLTADFVPKIDSPTENIVTACGTDSYGGEVCDTDLARIQLLLPAAPRPRLPRAGFSLIGWIAAGLNLIALGSAMILLRRIGLQAAPMHRIGLQAVP